MNKGTLAGSERAPLPGATRLGKADPNERFEATLILRRKTALPNDPPRLDRATFAATYGASDADIASVVAFAKKADLTVVQTDAGRRTVILSGTVASFDAAFNVQLENYAHAGGTYRGRTGSISLPKELDGVVTAVLGLDNRPQATPHFRVRSRATIDPNKNVNRRPASEASTSYTPVQLAALYDFPAFTGAGQCVGIIELGGGYRNADLATYFSKLNVGSPTVLPVSVDHGTNTPTGNPDGPDGEVMLDIEVVGAVAPQAKICVYFAPNRDASFINAVTTAIHDDVNKPSVISISWGGPEPTWTAQARNAMNEAFASAASLGVTVCIASGDDGSTDGLTDGKNHANFPASSPYALACGGTTLQAAGGTRESEVVWNDGPSGGASGGAPSAFFDVPSWQNGLTIATTAGKLSALTMRGVPDVSADADPATGYDVRIDGTDTVIGGTSAAAPLWAALIARLNEANGGKSLGFLNPRLYGLSTAFNDITTGNNVGYAAGRGWDACTGLGSPRGTALLEGLVPGVAATTDAAKPAARAHAHAHAGKAP